MSSARLSWQVPNYKTLFWQGKRSKYCVAIPVINEGDRILSLLKSMQAINLAKLADIIIVDGGSEDGSLDQENLKLLDVSGLILKFAPGKLSAQLRCVYAYVSPSGRL